MKKLSIFCGIALIMALMSGPVYAQSFGFDINQDGVMDDPCNIAIFTSSTVQVDVYLLWPHATNVGAIDWYFTWDPLVTVQSIDHHVPAVWTDGSILMTDPSVPPLWYLIGNGETGTGVAGPQMILASIVLHCEAEGVTSIGATLTGQGGNPDKEIYDTEGDPYQATPATCEVTQTEPICMCDVTPNDPADIIGAGEQLFTTAHIVPADCNTPGQWSWDVYNAGAAPDCADGYLDGCNYGDTTCLFKVDDVSAEQSCQVAVADLANWPFGLPFQSMPVVCYEFVDLYPAAGCATKIYRGGVCEESTPLDTIYNRPGRRGLSITCCEEEEFCVCSSCDPETTFHWTVTILPGSDPDFELNHLVSYDYYGDTFILKVKDPCTTYCPDEVVYLEVAVTDSETTSGISDSVIVQIGRVALGMGDTNAHPATETADVEVLLWNYENHVRAIQADICGVEMVGCNAYATEDECGDAACNILNEVDCGADADCQWKVVGGVAQCVNALNCAWIGECVAQDNVVCTECVVDEDRSAEFICSANEQPNGCCRVTLYTTEPDDLIQQGDGAVAIVKYDVGDFKTSKDCIELIPTEIKISDQFNEMLCAVPKAGEICFMICGDVYPQDCYECESCGDGVVDLFDILEEIDIVLGLQTASICQMMHGDVPLGMPPYCGNPAGVNPPNCETDDVIDIFDALVIIDKALSRMNCCDYCMYGQIY